MLNKVQSKSIKIASYEIWTNEDPYLSHLKVWGYLAYKKQTLSDKLEAKSDKCLFVGYVKEYIGYGFYNTLKQRLFASKHTVSLEKEFLLREDGGSKGELGKVQSAQTDAYQMTNLRLLFMLMK